MEACNFTPLHILTSPVGQSFASRGQWFVKKSLKNNDYFATRYLPTPKNNDYFVTSYLPPPKKVAINLFLVTVP
jgi:hypothetical protein